MLKCQCGTVAVPLSEKMPRGWTVQEGKEKYLCPLCSMVAQEKKRKEALN